VRCRLRPRSAQGGAASSRGRFRFGFGRFPEGNPVFRADPQKWKPRCVASQHSPFAVACDLGEKPNLGSVTQTLRAELTLRASGGSVQRSITFVDVWPSEVIVGASLDPSCSLLPILPGRSELVARLEGDFAGFDEKECHVD